MKLSEENQELLDQLYPDGYEIKKVDLGGGVITDEGDNYHVLFVKIFLTKGRTNFLNPMVQQFSVKDWEITTRLLDKGWGLASITGYDEFTVIHDPIEAAAQKKAAEGKLAAEEAEKVKLAAEKKAAEELAGRCKILEKQLDFLGINSERFKQKVMDQQLLRLTQ